MFKLITFGGRLFTRDATSTWNQTHSETLLCFFFFFQKQLKNFSSFLLLNTSTSSALEVVDNSALYFITINISGVASYGALGHVPPSTFNNFISLWSKSDSQLSKYCVVCQIS